MPPILLAVGLNIAAAAGLADIAGFHAVYMSLTKIRWPWLCAVPAALAMSAVGYELSRRRLTVMVTVGFGGLFDTGGIRPDGLILQADGATKCQAMVRLAALGGMEQAILALYGCAASIAWLSLGRAGVPLDITLPWAVIPIPAFSAAFWLASRSRARLVERAGWRARLSVFLDAVLLIRALFAHPVRHRGAIGGMALFWAGDVLAVWSALAAFGFVMDGAALIVGYCTGMVFTRRIAPLAGSGTLTLILPLTIWASSAPLATAITGVAAYRLLCFWLPLPLPSALASLPMLREATEQTTITTHAVPGITTKTLGTLFGGAGSAVRPRRRLSRKRSQSHRLCDACSPRRKAAWPQAGQPAPEEEIIVTAGIPHAGPAARQAQAATTAQPPRRLGLALAVIATAQLMVVLDLTIVNVALPHIQSALGFSGSNLEWVVNAYAVAFGGLLLLGGRSGDLLDRRRIFIAGLLVFVVASLLGGLATDQAWLITARAAQGVGAAMAAPTALSLIAVTFPEGPPRTRAVAVYSAMAIVGLVVGLLAGGLLVTYLSWRWVLFVNVPIGLVVAALAMRVLPTTGRRVGRFDLPGAVTVTAGVASLVYGLSNAATTPDGVSHWGDAKVVAALAAAAVLLTAFVVIETRSTDPLLPFRVLRNRDRSGAYLISLCVGTAMLGMFFFLTIFVQDVWGYSALKTGVAYLPFVPAVLATTVVTQREVTRVGAWPLLVAGGAVAAGGMFWLSRISEHSTFVSGMLGPELILGAGLGPLFVLIFLVGLTKVDDSDTGVASSLVNVGQQVGGSIGLAVVGTVAWSAVASSLRSQEAAADAAAAKAGLHPSAAQAAALRTQIYHHALATGFSRGFLVSAGVLALILIITLFMTRVRSQDLSGA